MYVLFQTFARVKNKLICKCVIDGAGSSTLIIIGETTYQWNAPQWLSLSLSFSLSLSLHPPPPSRDFLLSFSFFQLYIFMEDVG